MSDALPTDQPRPSRFGKKMDRLIRKMEQTEKGSTGPRVFAVAAVSSVVMAYTLVYGAGVIDS